MQILRRTDHLEVTVEVVNGEDTTKRFPHLVNPGRNLIFELGILALDLHPRVSGVFPELRIETGVVVAGRAPDASFRRKDFSQSTSPME